MSLAMIVYLISILPKIAGFMSVIGFLSGVALIFNLLYKFIDNSGYPIHKSIVAIFLVSAAVVIAIPSEKQMYVIAGAYAAQNVYESEIGQDTVKLLHSKIKEQIAEQVEKATDETTKAVKKIEQKVKEEVQKEITK